ncbi:MAG: O-methyltransferase [Bdellovibrionales bacterium]
MEKSFGTSDGKIGEYAEKVFQPVDAILEKVVERTQKEGIPLIQVGGMDGLHLEVLTRAFGAKKIVEIGTLAGYSAICMARALPENGKIYCFEVSPESAAIAQEHFKMAGVEKKTEIHVGPALEKLYAIENQGPFDLVFVDADKGNYTEYMKWAEKNLRIGGALLADNTFAWGLIADESITPEQKPSVTALRKFNQAVADSPRFRSTILPTGEGLTLAVKIS